MLGDRVVEGRGVRWWWIVCWPLHFWGGEILLKRCARCRLSGRCEVEKGVQDGTPKSFAKSFNQLRRLGTFILPSLHIHHYFFYDVGQL